MKLKPNGTEQVVNIGPKELIKIPLGYYCDVDLDRMELTVKNIYTDTIQCVHAGGKKVFKLNDKYFEMLMYKANVLDKFSFFKK
jgi:hypothetical protein